MRFLRSIPPLLALSLALGVPARGQSIPTFTGPAGTYTIVATAPVSFEYGQGYVTIRWTGPAPSPIPDPAPPGPTPPPVPPDPTPKIVGPIYVSLVLSNDARPGDAEMREGLLRADWVTLKVAGYRAYVEGQPELDALGLRASVQKAGTLPVVIVQAQPDGGGNSWPVTKILTGVKSAEDVLAQIKGLR